MKQRLKWVDTVKGIAMFSVVVCHVMNGYMTAGVFSDRSKILYAFQNIMNAYQMPLFCIMSGYLFSKAYISLDGKMNCKKIKKQILNLSILYIQWCLIMGIFKIVLRSNVNNEVNPKDILMIWCRPIGVFWWLYVLVALYLISYGLLKLNNKFVFAIAFISGIIGSLLDDSVFNGLFCVRRILYYFFFFYIGYLLNAKIDIRKHKCVIAVLFFVAIGIMVISWNDDVEIYHMHLLNLIVALGICSGIILVAQTSTLIAKSKFFSILGRNSLEVYTMHVFITAGIRVLVTKLGYDNMYVSILVTIAMAISVPLLVGEICRKMHIYNIAFCPTNIISLFKKDK